MKKFFQKITTIILICILSLTGLTGCRLVTIDSERDMNQVVAVVDIVQEDKIYKKDIIMAYMNYGGNIMNSYGFTQAQTIEYIVNSLVTNRIVIQIAMQEFEQDANYQKNTDEAVYTLERYLTEKQLVDALYNVHYALNTTLDFYEDNKEQEEKLDTIAGTVRTTPTNAVNQEKELTKQEKEEYINTPFDINSTESRRSAYNVFIKELELNNLKGNKYTGSLQSTDYYDQMIKSEQETLLIDTFEESISKVARQSILANGSDALTKIQAEYNRTVDEQKEFNHTEFVEKLSSATVNEPLLYSAYGNYGYVYNLLLGANELQTAKIAEIDKTLSKSEYAVKRAEILSATSIKDLRSSWITSGYDFDGSSKKFTGDYTFNKDCSFAFQGEVEKIKDATEDKSARYSVTQVKNFNLTEFLTEMDAYLGGTQQAVDINSVYALNQSADIYSAKNVTGATNYQDKINELLFAFSTDGGSLNTYKGYVIEPEVDGDAQEKFVESFATAGRQLIKNGKDGYVVVASDFGYHVMFFSQQLSIDSTISFNDYLTSLNIDLSNYNDSLVEYLDAMLADWEEFAKSDTPLYFIANKLVSATVTNAVSDRLRDIIDVAEKEQKQVKRFESVYADLLN